VTAGVRRRCVLAAVTARRGTQLSAVSCLLAVMMTARRGAQLSAARATSGREPRPRAPHSLLLPGPHARLKGPAPQLPPAGALTLQLLLDHVLQRACVCMCACVCVRVCVCVCARAEASKSRSGVCACMSRRAARQDTGVRLEVGRAGGAPVLRCQRGLCRAATASSCQPCVHSAP
jgi:hypothetical protein